MKNLLLQFAEYNLWANKRIAEYLLELTPEELNQEFPSSFKSIYETVQHLFFAENLWYHRILKQEPVQMPAKIQDESIRQFESRWIVQSNQWLDFMKNCREEDLHTIIDYANLKGIRFSQPLWQILHHLFNHGTYHRGQVITLLHHLGKTGLPATDFIVFARKMAQIQ